MSAFPLMPRDSTSARDRAIAAAANDVVRALDRYAKVAEDHGEHVLRENAHRDSRKYEALTVCAMEPRP